MKYEVEETDEPRPSAADAPRVGPAASKKESAKIHKQALERFARDAAEEKSIRDEAKIDIAFRAGDQWLPGLKKQRAEEGRPALTFDKTHVFIASVANEARQNKPEPHVNPIGGGATTDVANVLNGILRHVQYRSQADVAYDTALDSSTGSSFGYFRAITEYADEKTRDQEIRILPVVDQFSVYGVLIPTARRRERNHAFVIDSIPKDEYQAEFGTTDSPVDFDSAEWQNAEDWVDGDNIIIAEYWRVEKTRKTLRWVVAPDGGEPLPIYTDDKNYLETLDFVKDDKTGEPDEREVSVKCVYFCKIDGTRVIPGTETEWVGDSIPITAVLGPQLIVEGKVHLFSLISYIRDPQRLINLYESAIAEKIALGNRVPYLGYEGTMNGPKWQNANNRNYATLEVKPVIGPDGRLLPLPMRQQLEEQITALSMAVRGEVENLKSGMGIYDASLGNRSNEVSGAGIKSRQQQSNVTNFHFADNLTRAQWDFCRMLLKIIPKIYDRPGRQVRIVGEDQEQSVVVVNQLHTDEAGKTKHYPLDRGEYDVVVTNGPSYTTARAEGADTLQQFFQAAPQAVPLLGDLWVGQLDYPWAREGARRLKAAAPQNIVNEPDDQGMKIPPQVQQHLAELTAQHQQLTQAVHTLSNEIEMKTVEMQSRERIAAMQEETKRTIAVATLSSQEGITLLTQEIGALNQKYELLHAANMKTADHAHAQTMQEQAAAAKQQQDAQAQAHQAGMASDAQDAAANQQETAQAA